MEWKGRRKSDNVEDRRGKSTAKIGGGIGGIGIIVVIIYMLMGGNPNDILGGTSPSQVKTETVGEYKPSAEEEEIADFV
ncbi:MAG: neutral zinc metallopeptidase, partial [Kurthia sp.]